MSIFNKIFCSHKWQSHSKDKKETRTFMRNILGTGYNPTDITQEFTKEVLICEKCGKIKIIKY